MFAKLFTLFAVVAAVAGQAREYPAGVHPAICPNYPYCDVNTLAKFTPEGIPIPEWGLNPALLRAAAPEYPAGIQAAPRYPAGLPPALCPNYPYCW